MRIIQMGMGGMGNAWLEQCLPLDFIEYVGFVEVNPTIASAQATKHDLDPAIIYQTLPQALNAVDADGVIAVIPPQFRTETLKTCIEAGIGLMAEKPLAETMADAKVQRDLANNSDIVYMITQDYRYRRDLYSVKQILASGELGKIDAVHVAHYWGFALDGFRAEMPFPLLNDMSIHHFDLMRYFLESDPISLYGQSWTPAWETVTGKTSAHALLTFPDDVHVAYTASWATNGLRSTFEGDWRFECSRGVLVLRDGAITVQKQDSTQGMGYTYLPAEARPLVDAPYFRQQYLANEFREAVLEGKAPATTAQDNFHSLQMVFDVIASSQSGQVITR